MAKQCYVSTTFGNKDDLSDFTWLGKCPGSYDAQNGLHVIMDEKLDYWQRTFYKPEMIKDDGHFLYILGVDEKLKMETEFKLNPVQQFDQAGLMVRIDSQNWIKTGLEYVDGKCRLSCVVTRDGYSDWSTEEWAGSSLALRVYKNDQDFVVEAKFPEPRGWDFFRICHLSSPSVSSEVLKMGLFCCAPNDKGGSVTFHKFSMEKSEGHHHSN